MEKRNRKNRNDANPAGVTPLDFAAAGAASAFANVNSGYAAPFGDAFTNNFNTTRTNTTQGFNQNPFGMTGFGMNS